jgi:hypothetical protein
MTKTRGTICIDFDGVIHSYSSGWQGYTPTDPPTEGALEFVQDLLAMKFEVVIQSTRVNTPEGAKGTRAWLNRYGFPEDLKVTATKPPALLYIDDRAHRFEGDFADTFQAVMYGMSTGFETWTKRQS